VWQIQLAFICLLLVFYEDIMSGAYICCNLRGYDWGGYSLLNSSSRYKS